jgi:hypothetical protein
MSLGFNIQGNTGNLLGVNSNNEAQVALTQTATNSGFALAAAQSDPGAITGSKLVREFEVTEDYRLRTGSDTLIFNEFFTGTAINTSIWTAPVTTMTVTVAAGLVTLNAGNSTASAAVARVSSWKTFPIIGTAGVSCEIIASFPFAPVINNVTEWGMGIATGTSAPTDGAFFRFDAAGTFTCVINYNGTENQSLPIDFDTTIGINTARHFTIVLGEDAADFWSDDVLLARVTRPTGSPAVVSSNELPLFFRTRNTAVTSQAQQIRVSMANITINDIYLGKAWPIIMAAAGNASYQTPTGVAVAQTAQWTNSAAPTAFTPTNTTEPTGSTGLGGIFLVNASGLAANTDYIIQAYVNPAGTSTAPGRTLYIRDYKISCVNLGAANAASPLTWAVGLAIGGTSATLAATESATVKNRRILPAGIQSIDPSAPIGSIANELILGLESAIIVNQGERIQTVIRFLNYTSTASQQLSFVITLNGYWE